MNLLLVTLDQFRGECLSVAGHRVVRTPNLDRLAVSGVRLARHYSQAAPCSPGRACLYTGTYQMNNRVVANGTPLDSRLDNLARAARRAGFDSGSVRIHRPGGRSRARSTRRTIPGCPATRACCQASVSRSISPVSSAPWLEWLQGLGYDLPSRPGEVLATEPDRPEDVGVSAFLTNRYLDWLERQERPWFAHLSYLRPHPPYAAAGRWARAFDPEEVDMPIAAGPHRHPFHQAALRMPQAAAPSDEGSIRRMRAQYYGMIGDVDAQLGRIWDALEQARPVGGHLRPGDLRPWRAARRPRSEGEARLLRAELPGAGHRPRPRARRGPRDRRPRTSPRTSTSSRRSAKPWASTSPPSATACPSHRFLEGRRPPWWRAAATWEFDWRYLGLAEGAFDWPWDRHLERDNLAVRRCDEAAYVQFGDGSWRCYDLAADPTWRTEVDDPSRVLGYAQSMLAWRAEHADRRLTNFLLENGGTGRWPVGSLSGRSD